jgi:hypothetical protein
LHRRGINQGQQEKKKTIDAKKERKVQVIPRIKSLDTFSSVHKQYFPITHLQTLDLNCTTNAHHSLSAAHDRQPTTRAQEIGWSDFVSAMKRSFYGAKLELENL